MKKADFWSVVKLYGNVIDQVFGRNLVSNNATSDLKFTANELRNRVLSAEEKPKRIATLLGKNSAIALVEEAIQKNSEEIAAWIMGAVDGQETVITTEMEETTGFCFSDTSIAYFWKEPMDVCRKLSMRIKKDASMPMGYCVCEVWPE